MTKLFNNDTPKKTFGKRIVKEETVCEEVVGNLNNFYVDENGKTYRID